ncbi:hypothetical protein ACFFGR_04390 [Arthrobacter liuii]|uniref:DUF3618 domain-containing protein n=1 Tax=Arthrobacter liuii TaxID=1476996 RepID=A0ABQ2AM05_9MICC|nr:hypothetical protein [Arthrobacter liuii]GGH92293.1 hypothetical protein GCM10007170_10510 [Arthrobacter liuii]
MRTATTTEGKLHLRSGNPVSQLAMGREWATPGVQAALQRAVAALDTGIETASPRLQDLLRRLTNELGGDMEALTPRLHKQLKRVGPKTFAARTRSNPVRAGRPASRTLWWIVGLVALAAGAAVWRSAQASKEGPAPSLGEQ